MFNKPPEQPQLSDAAPMAGLMDALKAPELSSRLLWRNAIWRAGTIAFLLAVGAVLGRWLWFQWRVWWVWVVVTTIMIGGFVFTYFVWSYLDWLISEIADTLESVRDRNNAETQVIRAALNPPMQPTRPGPEHYVRFEVWRHSPGGTTATADYIDLPMSKEQYQLLAAKIDMWGGKIRVKQLTEGAGAIFKQGELDALLVAMVKSGFVYKQDDKVPNSPYVLTEEGRQAFGLSSGEVGPEFGTLPSPTNGRVIDG